jgi:hypothetical protein
MKKEGRKKDGGRVEKEGYFEGFLELDTEFEQHLSKVATVLLQSCRCVVLLQYYCCVEVVWHLDKVPHKYSLTSRTPRI